MRTHCGRCELGGMYVGAQARRVARHRCKGGGEAHHDPVGLWPLGRVLFLRRGEYDGLRQEEKPYGGESAPRVIGT
jgi:hypothetical protein